MGNLMNLLGSGLCIVVAYIFIKWFHKSRLPYSNGCLPPRKYPHKDPIFGLDLFFISINNLRENRLLPALKKRFSDHGRTHQTLNLGTYQINSIQPENVHTVFSSRSAEWGVQPNRVVAMEPFCGRGFITTDGEEWAHGRFLLTPGFHKSNISNLVPLEEHFQKMVLRIPKDGSTVDLLELFSDLYLDIASLFLFGESMGALTQEIPSIAEGVLSAFERAMLGSGIRIILGRWRFLYRDPKFFKACEKVHKFADYYVDLAFEYRKKCLKGDQPDTPQTRSLLYSMAKQTDDREDIRAQIIQAHMAAQESTGNLLANVFFLLSRHPRVWQKIREEVNFVGDDELTWDRVNALKYVPKVLHETLRLYPILPDVSRTALQTTTLPVGGGPDGKSPMYVPKGTLFNTSVYALHRDLSVWGPDAAEFKPERWHGDFKPGPGDYIPFGAGQRICLGQHKALTESAYIVVRILQEFSSIKSRDGREWTGQVQLTAKNANGCLVSLMPMS